MFDQDKIEFKTAAVKKGFHIVIQMNPLQICGFIARRWTDNRTRFGHKLTYWEMIAVLSDPYRVILVGRGKNVFSALKNRELYCTKDVIYNANKTNIEMYLSNEINSYGDPQPFVLQ